jgi:paraquat-inducible protein A
MAAPETAECRSCGLLQRMGALADDEDAVCPRCGARVRPRKPRSLARTRAFALAGLIVYGPANLLPLVVVDYHGMVRTATLWKSVRVLFEEGQWLIGCLVFTTSILTPALKLVSLFLLSWLAGSGRWRGTRLRAYQVMHVVNPWNMLEVFMGALIISIVKFGHAASVWPGAGAWFFCALVALTIMASESFDARTIWDEESA